MSTDSDGLRAALRADLAAAMKSRDADAVAALRTAIAAIDNAEAVDRPEREAATTSDRFAGSHVGVGSTEVARRDLTLHDVQEIVSEQMAERLTEADRYDQLGRREAAALAKYLPG
jgi:uncharacterized protein YqeY